ncbi:hypothetical protein DHB74_04185 [Pseudomonas sp. G11-1]|jgi:uncharacterized membrane protein YqjE|uniref:Putative Holin-X, holin superfamily III n=1 Tax=Halopseudomonas bauzanensis TaxID=653930 RepID=A0A031MKM2_9GAMM|nr:phage holin family protein [Halopseudomonas bauzanensis]MCO5785550.1 hypothetical protein [Pseudomonas sp. G11-1]MCO5788346.1 hypothetical protein [Pseudomonas sp. G11-2]EZQ20339.1 hypothetical protein CF98_04410 [Halopseudomonas bauzanensis]TKA93378.1 hypothetical protein FA869_04210 [Halopseudomonas bauzanensis]SER42274.1 Putative Holin-X, holin superfamily III [Halopseudomonas bauzanensis]
MTGTPGENRPESGDAGGQEQPRQPLKDELKSSLAWLEHAALAGGDLVRLAALELRLAAADSGKLVGLALAMVPLLLLAWIGLSVLLGWLVFAWSGSVAWGIVMFIIVQLAALGIMAINCKKYSKSLSFPATSRQLKTLKEEASGPQEADKSDSRTG